MTAKQTWRIGALTVLFSLIVVLSWTRHLDTIALEASSETFKRALTVAAIARGLNGVISVAQGTEVAIQPIGIGVTLTLGEILDPINDLVERFSLLALIASTSLGAQLLLGEILATAWFSAAVTTAAVICIYFIWRKPSSRFARLSQRILAGFIFLRFFLVLVLLVGHWVDTQFLQDRQQAAMQALSTTTEQIEALSEEQSNNDNPEEAPGFFDQSAAQIGSMLSGAQQSMDLKAQLQRLQTEVDASIEHIIRLIVVFILQTLVVPLATLWLAWGSLRAYGRYIRTE